MLSKNLHDIAFNSQQGILPASTHEASSRSLHGAKHSARLKLVVGLQDYRCCCTILIKECFLNCPRRLSLCCARCSGLHSFCLSWRIKRKAHCAQTQTNKKKHFLPKSQKGDSWAGSHIDSMSSRCTPASGGMLFTELALMFLSAHKFSHFWFEGNLSRDEIASMSLFRENDH